MEPLELLTYTAIACLITGTIALVITRALSVYFVRGIANEHAQARAYESLRAVYDWRLRLARGGYQRKQTKHAKKT